MRTRNNELVIDERSYTKALPFAVEAFFYMAHSEPKEAESVRAYRNAFVLQHSGDPRFSAHFGVDAAPVLRLDLEQMSRSPFALDEGMPAVDPSW